MRFIHLLVLLSCASTYLANDHPDEIISLPGLTHRINFKQYSGSLNASSGVFFHYWFVESQRSPSTDPLLLWLNGGPGCSSLSGLLTENGPFKVNLDGKSLHANHYSWNKIANILFLESPAGTGFSYSTFPQTYLDDELVASANFNALKHFFIKFPQFVSNDFYVTGESYGGIYVPTLSVKVLDDPDINFKGFAIGNGCMDTNINSNSLLFFTYYHGFMGSEFWNRMVTICCQDKTATPYGCNFGDTNNTQCQSEGIDVLEKLLTANLNVYNVFESCSKSANIRARYSFDHSRLTRGVGLRKPNSTDAQWDLSCLEAPNVHHYLNRDSVRQALHVPKNVEEWVECSNSVNDIYNKDNRASMKPQILKLVNSGKVRGLIYNGDVDMVCNFLGDEWFVHELGLDVIQPYSQWKYDDQIAGFAIYYKNLAFITVKGSGHMVPQDKPGPAFRMISNFLENKSY